MSRVDYSCGAAEVLKLVADLIADGREVRLLIRVGTSGAGRRAK
jgi:hypothetical protein